MLAGCKEHISCQVSCSNFADVLPVFICARFISNLLRICLGVNILRHETKSRGLPVTSIGANRNI